jgi:hypothetical protein
MKMPASVTSCALGFLSVAPAIFHLLAIEARPGFFQTALAVVFGRPDRPFGAVSWLKIPVQPPPSGCPGGDYQRLFPAR